MKLDTSAKFYSMSFALVYPPYLQKIEKKGRTRAELDEVITWLTGYDLRSLRKQIQNGADFNTFFEQAPHMHPNASKITGVICGYRIEDIQDQLEQKVRYMDKLVDELAHGKSMEQILRR